MKIKRAHMGIKGIRAVKVKRGGKTKIVDVYFFYFYSQVM
jgi:hypothetical protein